MIIADVQYLGDYRIRVTFRNGEYRIVDFISWLSQQKNPMTAQFMDMERFSSVKAKTTHLEWEDGEMDISAQSIYDGDFDSIEV